MNRRILFFLAALLGAAGAGADVEAQVVAPPSTTCVGCHGHTWNPRLRAPVTALPGSVHGEERVPCTGCHGGRGDVASTAAHDPAAAFRPAPAHADVADLCGGCHDAHGDQLIAWLGSRHATSAAMGGPGATCLDCHGAHGVLRVEDPRSPAHPDHVSATCGGCHGNAVVIGPTALSFRIPREVAASVHGRARAAGNGAAPTCAGCHDPHAGAAGLAAVSACGGCHEGPKRAFEEGPHAVAYASRGFLDCVECHDSHDVQRADYTLVVSARDGACRRCHAPGQPVFEDVQRIARLVTTADLALAEVGFGPEGAERVVPVPGSALAQARDALIDAVHGLDVEALDAAARRVVDEAPKATRVGLDGRPLDDGAPATCRVRRSGPPRLGGLVLLAAVGVGAARRRRSA